MRKVFVPVLSLLFINFVITIAAGYSQEQKNITARQKNEGIYSWDFGKAKEGVILKRTFMLKNESKTALTIKNISTSCGCTVSKVKKKRLTPQETTSLTVRFNTKGYSGPVKQYVYITIDNLNSSDSSLDHTRDDPGRVKRVEGALSIDGKHSQTIDSPIIRLIIKAEVIK